MLLGVAGLTPGGWATVDQGITRLVRDHGVRALQLRLSDPVNTNPATVERVQSAFKFAGLTLGQTVG